MDSPAVTSAQLLTLLQHGDGQFPTGAFAYSSGLEGLLSDAMTSRASLPDTIAAMVRCRWAPFDRVAVRMSWLANGDLNSLVALDDELEATLLAPAERSGSKRAGAALLTTHVHLDTPGAAVMREHIAAGTLHGHRALVEGSMWRSVGLDEKHAALLSGYSFVSVLCTACVRLGHLGALAQQRIVAALLAEIARFAVTPLPATPTLSAFNPLAEIAVMRHAARDHALFAT